MAGMNPVDFSSVQVLLVSALDPLQARYPKQRIRTLRQFQAPSRIPDRVMRCSEHRVKVLVTRIILSGLQLAQESSILLAGEDGEVVIRPVRSTVAFCARG